MKIVINIPEDYYEYIKKMPDAYKTQSFKVIANGTPLPKTNGEVIQTLFPQLNIIGLFETTERRIMVKFDKKDDTHDFKLDWWNAIIEADKGDKK